MQSGSVQVRKHLYSSGQPLLTEQHPRIEQAPLQMNCHTSRPPLTDKALLQVTTFSVCPGPVAAVHGGLSSAAGGQLASAVAVLAAVTRAGTVELVTLRKGPLQPLHASISASLGTQNWLYTLYSLYKEIVRQQASAVAVLTAVTKAGTVELVTLYKGPCNRCTPFCFSRCAAVTLRRYDPAHLRLMLQLAGSGPLSWLCWQQSPRQALRSSSRCARVPCSPCTRASLLL